VRIEYRRGLHEVADGLYAYLQPDGGWGWSNAGLVTAGGTSLLVDTLFDLALTRAMLDAMRPVTDRHPIDAAMNTHANGDHCYGNELLPSGAEIYASAAAAAEMPEVPPQALAALKAADLGPEFRRYIGDVFGPFSFEDIELRPPTSTFEGRLDLRIGDRDVHLIEVGPAHTTGDTIVHVPDAAVVFTGDILFVGGTPIMWRGPVANWLRACDRILETGAGTLVPGHGPVTDADGVEDVRRYLTHVRDEATARFEAGMDAEAAADDIDLSAFAGWGEPERIAVNVEAIYRELDPARPAATPPELFVHMARWAARHRARPRP
jgi:glyoxylase-like metal-dependent hydrolase (beta-lactamase superfamily II)